MAKFIKQFENLKKTGARFIRINNYVTATNEVANYTVNVGISVENAKKSDLEALQTCDKVVLVELAKSKNIELSVFEAALNEMIISGEKNLSANIDEHTNQSKGQIDAYIPIVPGLKLCKETMALHIFGQVVKKDVIIKGEYKTVKSSDKTLAKEMIKTALNLRAHKFRTYILNNVGNVKINGETFEVICV